MRGIWALGRHVLVIGVLTGCLMLAGHAAWYAALRPHKASAGGQQTVTRQFSPTANAAVTTGAGDNNGFETTPTNAYASDGVFAVDTDSGLSTNNTCTAAGADRHRFYTYGFGLIPSGSTVNGIQVRADIAVDSLTSSPFTCVDLSYDAGTSFTTAKQATLTSVLNTTYLYGNSTDTWGRTWTVSELSDANFRVQVTNGDTNNISSLRDFSLDWLPASVTFTAPFDSYSNSGRTAQSDTFTASPNTVYVRGTGFPTGSQYNVAYYDGGGTKRFQEGPLSVAGGNLDSAVVTSSYPSATAGTWHAVVQRSGGTAFPAAYSSIDQDVNDIVADDTFTVQSTALPEFPTAAAGIASVVLSVAGYEAIRRRMQARVQTL